MKVTVNKYLFFTFVSSTVLMEFIQFFLYGEHIAFLGSDLLFMSFVGLFLCHWRLIFIISVLTIFEVTETISFMIIGNGVDFQVIGNADMEFVLKAFKPHLFMAIAASIGIYVMFKCVFLYTEKNKKFQNTKNLTINFPVWVMFSLIITSFSLFYMKEYYTFFPFYSPFCTSCTKKILNASVEDELLWDMNVSLYTKLNLTKVPEVKRNLIVIVMESIEKLCVGRFNPIEPHVMPIISNISLSSQTFLGESQEYTSYSVASLFSAMCGYPFINTPTLKGNDSPIYKVKKVKCVWDYLRAAGYKMYAKSTRYSFGVANIGNLMKLHGVTLEGEWERWTHDFDIINNSLTSIKRHMKEGKPFMYMIFNVDTHFPYFLDPKCNVSLNRDKQRRCLNCLDYDIWTMLEEFIHMKIWETTDIVVYGDHLNFWKLGFYGDQKRETFLMFPKLQDLGKDITIEPRENVIYDIAPSILDMLGFEYKPKYPFGRSLFKPGYEKRVPSNDHIKFFYEAVKDEVG